MSKKSLIDSIEVKDECLEDWNEMTGSDTARFCGHCDLNVHNVSALSRKQAMRLVRQSNGRICVRYVKNPVDNKPVFTDKLYQITSRVGIAAGVLGTTLALSTLAYAQGKPALNKSISDAQTEEFLKDKDSDKDKFDGTAISFSGTITDSVGAVIPNATVTLTNLKTNESRAATTDSEGVYKFENVVAARYKVQAIAAAFKESVTEINVYNSEESGASLSLEPSEEIFVTMGMIALSSYSTPLFRAVSNDDIEEIKDLVAKGENVNQKDENYNFITPLFLAVENGNAEIAETLLNFGAKINPKDGNKQTPLMRLDEDASPELVNLLIKHGAKINLADKEGNTALILASRSVKAEVLRVLINHSANINAKNTEGRTALMEAADADNLENVRALLEAGANVSLKDRDGETAFDLTTNEKIEKLLAEYGAVVENDSN